MPAQDAVKPVTTAGAGIQNGSLVTLVFESGSNAQKRAPDVNQFVESGVMNVRTSGRFDEHYGGGAS
jgi:hypothetical protein|tara:strand:+ start:473 stop:673 length:201 start_codon:yes stop_codon:yes gene_type:complete